MRRDEGGALSTLSTDCSPGGAQPRDAKTARHALCRPEAHSRGRDDRVGEGTRGVRGTCRGSHCQESVLLCKQESPPESCSGEQERKETKEAKIANMPWGVMDRYKRRPETRGLTLNPVTGQGGGWGRILQALISLTRQGSALIRNKLTVHVA